MLQSAQLALGLIVGAIAVATSAIAVAGWLRPPMSRLWLDRAVLAGTGAALVAALTGALAFATATGPGDPLHFVYAIVAVAALPIARAWGSAPRPGPMLVGGLVLLGVTVRLFQTG
jgi:hypothetical protein